MTLQVRRRYTGPRVHERANREDVKTLVQKLVNVWGEEKKYLAANVAWWRFRHGLSLKIRKVLP